MVLRASGKSDAQDSLADLVRQTMPWMSVRQEVPLSSIVSAAGYSTDEIAVELRHRPSDMSVDIYATDLSDAIAFEYQGEQHYRTAGRMNASENAVRYDQTLDAEKAWILQRIGVPIVQIAYDDPLSKRFLQQRIMEAREEVAALRMQLMPCSSCGRLFPAERLEDGLCYRCVTDEDADCAASRHDVPGDAHDGTRHDIASGSRRRAGMHKSGSRSSADTEALARRRERLRAERKARRDEYRKSEEYADMMERRRVMRHERYLEAKQRRKREGR